MCLIVHQQEHWWTPSKACWTKQAIMRFVYHNMRAVDCCALDWLPQASHIENFTIGMDDLGLDFKHVLPHDKLSFSVQR